MKTIGLLQNHAPLQPPVYGFTLFVGSPGTGKTHLALNMAIADFEAGLPVIYISADHEGFDRYLHNYIPHEKVQVLVPSQIDFNSLLGDVTLALSFADMDNSPEHHVECSKPIIKPGSLTLINLRWRLVPDDKLRNYFVGRILQHLSLCKQPVSLFVDGFYAFEKTIEHPIIQYWLTHLEQPTTFIIQQWLEHKKNIADILENISYFMAFRQHRDSAKISSQILFNRVKTSELEQLNNREAFIRHENDVSFIRLIESPHQVP